MINYSIYIASSKPGTKKADIAPKGFPFWGMPEISSWR